MTRFAASDGMVYGVAFSPDGQLLASTMAGGAESHTVHIWDLKSLRLATTLRGHTASPTNVAFSRDGRLLASCSGWAYVRLEKGEIFLWDVATWKKMAELAGHNSSVGWANGFSPDGTQFVSAHGDGLVRIWDLASRQVVHSLRGHNDVVLSAKFSSDGEWVASGDISGMVRLLNSQTRLGI